MPPPSLASAPDSFPRSARFAFRRRLGAGGFGVVYEAEDRERGTRVALKTLQQLDAGALYAFKREFRALCDIVHPNLVNLHELVAEDDHWFFTMDLVEGTDFFSFVRTHPAIAAASTVLAPLGDSQGSLASPAPPLERADLSTVELPPTQEAQAAPSTGERQSGNVVVRDGDARARSAADPERWSRLRDALRQLALGLRALHGAGKLHRDLKPSNVLVTRDGRVVILDFGLVASVPRGQTEAHPSVGAMAGTPAYMAPEQALGEASSPANDWYSVGVMLYEALTGRLPFEGPLLQLLLRKQREDAAPPRSVDPSVPEDLDELCLQLLRRSPEDRPSGPEVLQRLSAVSASASAGPPAEGAAREPATRDSIPFVGRERHLSSLRAAFERATGGKATTVHIRGVSGMGKSALVQHFLDDVAADGAAVILQGRCYERESVPYKAVDNLIDSLSRHLSRLPGPRAAELMPRDVHALVRLFPVLDRVKAIADAPHRGPLPPDAQELRRRGFAALREMLGRIADRQPLVVYVDDLQWGDADSALLLGDLLREPDAPALLLLIGYRSEDAGKSEMLRKLPAWVAVPAGEGESAEAGKGDIRDLLVGALDRGEARDLALRVLGPAGTGEQAERIAEEAAGSPFFVHELARAAREAPGASGAEIRLENVLGDRLSRLQAEARSLLEAVAIAGKPLSRGVAREAAGLSPDDERTAMGILRAERILRSRGAGDDEELETFHDRIRETAIAKLDPEGLAERHLRLGTVLEASGAAEPDMLALHFRRAGRPDKAAPYAIQAGDRAAEALAFDRAAALYAYALEVAPGDAARRRDLQVRLGDAHKNAGRGADAAREYSAAAESAPPGDRLDLQRRAAEQLLWSGRLEEGRRMLREVLASVGVPFHQNRWVVLLSLLFWRALVRLHGLRVRGRRSKGVSPILEARMEALWSATVGLMMSDVPRATEFHARYFWMALRAGDSTHLSRGLSFEAGVAAMASAGGRQRAERAYREAAGLAEEVGDPYLVALGKLMLAAMEGFTGRWLNGLAHARTAEEVWLGRCAGVHGELMAARIFMVWPLFQIGDLHGFRRVVAPLRRDAESRGDLTALAYAGGFDFMLTLAEDQPEAAREGVQRAMARWSAGPDIPRLIALVAHGRIDLYVGDPLAARSAFADYQAVLVRTLVLGMQVYRVMFYDMRASFSLAAAAKEDAASRLSRTLLREGAVLAGRVGREEVPWALALSTLRRAAIASLRNDQLAASTLLDSSISQLAACDMHLYAASARRRKGQLLGGGEGRALVEAADAWMAEQGIKNPARMTEVFAPGFRLPV